MSAHPTPDGRKSLDGPDDLLVGSLAALQTDIPTCPWAQTLVAYSAYTGSTVLIALTCRRWGCPHCGRKKTTHFAHRVRAAAPTSLITLTVNPNCYCEPREAYDDTRRQLSALATKLRRRFDEFEYFRVLEVTRKGWPHYHLVARAPYIPQRLLSEMWAELTAASIVDVRAIKKVGDVYSYIVKYLAKQKAIPWTNRRVSWSRGFFPDDDFEPGPSLNLFEPERFEDHPHEWLAINRFGRKIRPISDSAWELL